MTQLSREGFQLARNYLVTCARPLERALFAFHFEGTGTDQVLHELAAYQNEDGGFGHALEPDFRTPGSSALATGLGLQLLRDLGIQPEHPMVRRAVAYLMSTLDRDNHTWRAVPEDTHLHPHAPWWHDENGSLAERFDHFRIIPRALVTGLLHHYASLVPAVWLDEITEEAVHSIESVQVLGEGGGSDLEYAIILAESNNLPQNYRERLKRRILQAIPDAMVRDAAMWDSYCITPLKVVSFINSIGANLIWNELQQHLDYQVEHQSKEGCWEPSWSWGGYYPEDWEQARQEWCGHLTLQTLKRLEAFGRIEGFTWDVGVGSCTL